MIPTSEPPTVIGVDGGNDAGTIRMEADAAPFHSAAPEISMDAAAPPVVLMEPEPAVFMAPEAPSEPAPGVPSSSRRIAAADARAPPVRRARAGAAVPVLAWFPRHRRPSQEDLAALDQILNPKAEDGRRSLDKSVAEAAAPSDVRARARSLPGRGAPAASSSSARPASPGHRRRAGAGRRRGVVLRSAARATRARTRARMPDHGDHGRAPVTAGTAPSDRGRTGGARRPCASAARRPLRAAPAGDARALLQGGNYPEAARLFAAELKAAGRNAATIQLLIACSTETVQKAVANVGAMELLIVPHAFQGRDCYRLAWGIYPIGGPGRGRAAHAARSISGSAAPSHR